MTVFRREYAYYWTCPRCNRECVTAEIVAGDIVQCRHCQQVTTASVIIYDNGAVARFFAVTEGQGSGTK